MLALVLGLVLAPLLPVALAQDPGPTLTLVWTGGSGGVGSGKVSWETPRRLRARWTRRGPWTGWPPSPCMG